MFGFGSVLRNHGVGLQYRPGDTAALSSVVAGTTLKLLPSAGVRDGVDDYVTITDANFAAPNIKKDIVMLGLTGTGPSLGTGSLVSAANFQGEVATDAYLNAFIDPALGASGITHVSTNRIYSYGGIGTVVGSRKSDGVQDVSFATQQGNNTYVQCILEDAGYLYTVVGNSQSSIYIEKHSLPAGTLVGSAVSIETGIANMADLIKVGNYLYFFGDNTTGAIHKVDMTTMTHVAATNQAPKVDFRGRLWLYNGEFYALAQTGASVVRYNQNLALLEQFYLKTSDGAANLIPGLFYFNMDTFGDFYIKTADTAPLIKVSGSTRRELWRTSYNIDGSMAGFMPDGSPIVSFWNGTSYANNTPGWVYILNRLTGAIVSKTKAAGSPGRAFIDPSPSLAGAWIKLGSGPIVRMIQSFTLK